MPRPATPVPPSNSIPETWVQRWSPTDGRSSGHHRALSWPPDLAIMEKQLADALPFIHDQISL
jgi:hypothetical protein